MDIKELLVKPTPDMEMRSKLIESITAEARMIKSLDPFGVEFTQLCLPPIDVAPIDVEPDNPDGTKLSGILEVTDKDEMTEYKRMMSDIYLEAFDNLFMSIGPIGERASKGDVTKYLKECIEHIAMICYAKGKEYDMKSPDTNLSITIISGRKPAAAVDIFALRLEAHIHSSVGFPIDIGLHHKFLTDYVPAA